MQEELKEKLRDAVALLGGLFSIASPDAYLIVNLPVFVCDGAVVHHGRDHTCRFVNGQL
jgi:hypothetical protein